MRRLAIACVILLCGIWTGGKAKADVCDAPTNLIKNCGFETGSLTSWTATPPGLNGVWYGVDNFDAFTGANGAFLAGFGSFDAGDTNFAVLSQTVTTKVGTKYTLSYDWAHNTSADPTATPDDVFAAFINNAQVPGSAMIDVDNTGFLLFAQSFIATSTSTTVQFVAEDANFVFSLDDVVLSNAPEPATFLLVGPIIGSLLLLRRRGKAKS